MPVRRQSSGLEAWLKRRDQMRLLYQATNGREGGEWLEENDREWLERYLQRQSQMDPNRYYRPQRIGYY